MSPNLFIKNLVKRIVRLADYFFWLLFSPYKFKKIDKTKIEKILVINTAFLGDLLATTPLIKNLKREFRKVDVLVSEPSKELLKNNPGVDKIFTTKDYEGTLKSKLYDTVVCVWPCDFKTGSDLKKAKIPYRLGATQQSRPEPGRFFMTRLAPPLLVDKHKVLENIMIVKPILNKQVPYPMELFLSTKDKTFARGFLLKNKIKKFAIIHAGARSKGSKEWTDEKFAKVADYLIEKKGLKIIFGGAEKDRAKNESIISKMKNKSNAINLAGKTSLLEYAALISKANLVVSVSTAALHIACAFKVKLLGLYSENLKIWYPWENPNSRTIYKENLSEITSEEAISKINELLPN